MIRISVIGSGYVGLVAAACFAELGHQVTCIDNDSNRVAALQRGEIPIYEQFLPDLLQRHRGGRLRFTGDLAEALREIYAPLTNGSYYGMQDAIGESGRHISPARLLVTTAKSAELIKHASNAYLAMKISFINAVAALCEQVGADVDQVRDGVGADARIGPNFLNPGIGYGGSCFPKDIKAFRAVASAAGYDFRLLDEVMRINDDQCRRFIAKVRNALWILKGKRLAVLGLAFKGGTDDIRQSQAIVIIQMLLKEGCTIAAYDPAAVEKTKSSHAFPTGSVIYASDPYQAAREADAVLVLTD